MTALIVTTSVDQMPDGRPTGAYASELVETWARLVDLGYDITIASVVGGEIPIEARRADDAEQNEFFSGGPAAMLADTVAVGEAGDDFDLICIIGGHGAMIDLPNDTDLGRLVELVHARGGVVAAVCHGVAGLLGRNEDGAPFLRGRRVAAFTDDEERAVGMTGRIPYLLSEVLAAVEATHEVSSPFLPHVVVDDRVVTGQNPASAAEVAATAGRLAADPGERLASGAIRNSATPAPDR